MLQDRLLCSTAARKQHYSRRPDNFKFCNEQKACPPRLGLSYYSERTEDMATDIRLIKEVFTSAHIGIKKALPRFVEGYASVAGRKKTDKILENVRKIEQRGRYARVT